MPLGGAGAHVEADVGHAEHRMRPKRSASGVWTWMRLPHGQTVSTQSLLSRKSNLVPSSFALAHRARAGRSSASRSGDTSPTTPRSTSGVPIGR